MLVRKTDSGWRPVKKKFIVTFALCSVYNDFLDTQLISGDAESKISQTVSSYNRELTQDPHNEELWLKYVDYQVRCRKYDLCSICVVISSAFFPPHFLLFLFFVLSRMK